LNFKTWETLNVTLSGKSPRPPTNTKSNSNPQKASSLQSLSFLSKSALLQRKRLKFNKYSCAIYMN